MRPDVINEQEHTRSEEILETLGRTQTLTENLILRKSTKNFKLLPFAKKEQLPSFDPHSINQRFYSEQAIRKWSSPAGQRELAFSASKKELYFSVQSNTIVLLSLQW